MTGAAVPPVDWPLMQEAVRRQLKARREAQAAKDAWASAPSPQALAFMTTRAREELRTYAGLVAALGYDGSALRALADTETADDSTWWFLFGRILAIGSEP